MAYGEGAYGEGVYGGAQDPYTAAVLADSPWGFWRLAEPITNAAANDGSGSDFQYGSVTRERPALVADGGYSVAGSGSTPVASVDSIPASLAGASVSFEAWINVPTSNVVGAFLDIGTAGSTGNGWAVGIGGSTMEDVGKQLILLHETVAWKVTGYTFATGVHHVAVTRSAANLFTVYVDGASVYTSTFAPVAPTGGIYIGGGSQAPARSLSSTVDVDNVALFASELSAARISAHYNGGAGDNSAVLADSPTVFLKFDETSFVDSSGNSRSLIPYGDFVPNQVGPAGDAIAFGTGAGSARTAATMAQPTVGTYEAWVYLDAYPAATTELFAITPTSGATGTTMGVSIDTSGRLIHDLYTGDAASYTAPSALSLGAWHHVAASVGAAGAKLRVDKVTVASSATTTAVTSATSGASLWVRGGLLGASGTGAMKVAEPAFYLTQLSDVRTDAHYDAAPSEPTPATGTLSATLPPLSASLSGGIEFSGTITATLPTLGANLAGTSLPPGVAGTLSAALPALSADLAGTSTEPSYSGTLEALLPSLSADLTGQSFQPGLEGYIEALLPALSVSLSGDVLGRNGLGLALDSSAVLTVEAPLEPEPTVPPGTPPTVLHVIAPTVPVPTLVNGRPQ